ncbi:hypothetical protein ACFMPD_10740 [Sedimentitalea sp. HM32M-2]|uniref:hypothetical protein n=1 Tax=Sedimentitalea sp. HM32M-2 TaxID=3351566 RepID=UPI00362B5F23
MSNLTLSETRLQNGIWQGCIGGLHTDAPAPDIQVSHREQPVDGIDLTRADDGGGTWLLSFPVPAAALSDGVHTILITDAQNDTRLGEVTLIAGAAASGDLRAELDLLRAELDLLKRVFRQHLRDCGHP